MMAKKLNCTTKVLNLCLCGTIFSKMWSSKGSQNYLKLLCNILTMPLSRNFRQTSNRCWPHTLEKSAMEVHFPSKSSVDSGFYRTVSEKISFSILFSKGARPTLHLLINYSWRENFRIRTASSEMWILSRECWLWRSWDSRVRNGYFSIWKINWKDLAVTVKKLCCSILSAVASTQSTVLEIANSMTKVITNTGVPTMLNRMKTKKN